MAKRSLYDAVYKAITGRTPRLERGPMAARVDFLEKKYGSLAGASRATGVSRSTLRRWRDGEAKPKPASERKLTQSLRKAMVPERRQNRIRRSTGRVTPAPGARVKGPGHGGISITATVRVSDDERERTLNIGQHLDQETAGRLLDAFMAGDDAQAQAIMEQGMTDYFGTTSWQVSDVSDISFDPIR